MRYALLLLLVFLPSLWGCIPATRTPIPSLTYSNPAPEMQHRKLMILLRGIWGGNDIFAKQGLVDAVFVRRLPFDIVAPDAHFGYYHDESLGRRLQQDIIEPAREHGYREIWIVGVSLGGMGALLYQKEYPHRVDGIVLINPFLGWGNLAGEVAAAGGIRAWEPGPHSSDDWERYLWAGIKSLLEEGPRRDPLLYLGYGRDDYFVNEERVLAASLPPDHVRQADGGHDYATMKKLWQAMLERLDGHWRR